MKFPTGIVKVVPPGIVVVTGTVIVFPEIVQIPNGLEAAAPHP